MSAAALCDAACCDTAQLLSVAVEAAVGQEQALKVSIVGHGRCRSAWLLLAGQPSAAGQLSAAERLCSAVLQVDDPHPVPPPEV